MDSTISAKAEDALRQNFNAIKQADIQLQSNFGERKANIGVNIIGSFAADDTKAFGWQLRAYGGEDSTKGANAGVFYRTIINRHSRASGNLSVQKIQNPLIIGANIFGDYENNDKGDFLRYSIGGELRDKHFALAANFYLPIADERKVNSTVIAFSRRGYDAKLRAAIPHLDIAKVAVDYYRFRGRGDTKADKGFRYGAELHPLAGFRIGVLYDDNAKKIGGDIAYSHSIGEVQTQQNNNADNFTPDLFSAVSREYSQRIATAAIGPGISLSISIVGRTTTFITMAAITTTTTMTTPEMVVRTRTETEMVAASRAASVNFMTYLGPIGFGGNAVVSTRQKILVTLPPASTPPPHVLTINRSLPAEYTGRTGHFHIIASDNAIFINQVANFGAAQVGVRNWTITIVEGSEERVGEPTTTTLTQTITRTTPAETTTTTMTMMAITTTIRTTTFATMTITLGATSAINTSGANANINNKTPLTPSPIMPIIPQMPIMPKIAMADIPIMRMAITDTPITRHSPNLPS